MLHIAYQFEYNFDAYNLSDIFEYMSEESMKNIYETILNKSNKNAKVMYWNMLVDRKCPKEFSEKIEYNISVSDIYLILNNFLLNSAWFLEKTAESKAPWTLYGNALEQKEIKYIAEHLEEFIQMRTGIGDMTII